MTEPEQKPRGRPKKYAGKRPNWTFRLEEKYGDQVKALAEQSGRSISEVCEQLIVDAFRMEIMLDTIEKKNDQLTKDLNDCRLAFSAAQMRMENAEEKNLYLSQHIASTDERARELEESRNSLLLRVDDLILLLAKTQTATAVESTTTGGPSHQHTFGRPARSKGRRFWKAQAKLAQLHRGKALAN
jgi:hypothetical protein